jgi:hypothetical protein
VRVNITNLQTLNTRKAAIDRYMKAYRETIDWMYSDDPKALATYAEFVGIPLEMAKRTRDQFFPKAAVDPDRIVGLDTIVPDAVYAQVHGHAAHEGTAHRTDPDSAALMTLRVRRRPLGPSRAPVDAARRPQHHQALRDRRRPPSSRSTTCRFPWRPASSCRSSGRPAAASRRCSTSSAA